MTFSLKFSFKIMNDTEKEITKEENYRIINILKIKNNKEKNFIH